VVLAAPELVVAEPVEVGGDIIGLRRSVEYRIAKEIVPVVDWAKLH
jgi:hypothetical protein